MDFSKIKKFFIRNRIPFILFIFAILIRIIFVYIYQIRIWDETVYANLGYDLSLNPFHYAFDGKWSDYVPSSDLLYSWPNAGFRAPLLPYFLAIFYFFKIDFLIDFLMPLIGALTVVLVYNLGKKLLGEKSAFYGALFLLFIPIHVLYSSRIMTDVFSSFFIILSIFSFWKGYELGNKKYKLLFGVFLAFAILARYTSLFILPLFLIYFLFRDKSCKFLKDKYIWFSVILFFVILFPWLLYGQMTYNNPLGAFIHGSMASTYWGGINPWYFFFQHSWQMFSILSLAFVVSLVYVFYKKEFIRKEIFLLLVWIILIFGSAMLFTHKEDRFVISALPPLCLLTGFFIDKIRSYKFRNIVLVVIVLITLFSIFNLFSSSFNISHNINNQCYGLTMEYLNSLNYTYAILSENSAIAYYYTQKESAFYRFPLNEQMLSNLVNSTSSPPMIVYNQLNSGMSSEELEIFKKILKNGYKKEFECLLDSDHNFVYSFK